MTGRLSEFVVLFPAVLALSWIVLGVLAAAIEALLAQHYPALQIHVVSDGSTDQTSRSPGTSKHGG